MRRTHTTIMSIFILILSWALLPAHAEGYMKIEGIEGNSTEADHQEWIPILSLSEKYSIKPSSSTRFSGGIAGEPIIIEKRIDNTSPALRKKLVQGIRFPEVELHYGSYELTLSDVSLTSISAEVVDGDIVETISMKYTRAEWTVVSEGKTGNKITNTESSNFNAK